MSLGANEYFCNKRRTKGLKSSEPVRVTLVGSALGAAAWPRDGVLCAGALRAVPPAGAASPANCKRASTSSGLTSALTALSTSIKVPLTGAGTSTVTLSVSNSTSGSSLATASPTALSHFKMVARVPSSFGGASTSSMRLISRFDEGDDGLSDGLDAGQNRIEQQGIVRTGHVRHGKAFDRGVEIEEGFLCEHG